MFILSMTEKDVLNQHLKPYQSKNVCIYEILSHFRMIINLKFRYKKIQPHAIKLSRHMLRALY